MAMILAIIKPQAQLVAFQLNFQCLFGGFLLIFIKFASNLWINRWSYILKGRIYTVKIYDQKLQKVHERLKKSQKIQFYSL